MLRPRAGADARLHLRRAHDALLVQDPQDAVEPSLEVGGGEVPDRRHALDRVAELVDVVEAGAAGGTHDADDRGLPPAVEGWLVRVAVHGAEAVHAAEIVDAVHAGSSGGIVPRGALGRRRRGAGAAIMPGTYGTVAVPLRDGPQREEASYRALRTVGAVRFAWAARSGCGTSPTPPPAHHGVSPAAARDERSLRRRLASHRRRGPPPRPADLAAAPESRR